MRGHAQRSFDNILWKGFAYGVNIAGGILLSPYIIRKIGIEGYGIWALVFAIVEYIWLSDMGLRSATLKFAAHHRARGESGAVNEVLSTGLAYFSVAALILLPVVVLFPPFAYHLFSISPHYRDAFRFVFWTAGSALVVGLIFNVFRAALEGFQEFGVLGRIDLVTIVIRVGGSFTVLALGGELRALGLVILAAQMTSFTLTAIGLRSVFPEFHVGLSRITKESWRKMTGYGVHTLVATIATQVLQQGPVVIIGALTNPLQVGYYSLPMRLLIASGDLAAQVGMVSGSSSADLAARQEFGVVASFGATINRYCLALFMPVALGIWIYGPALMQRWLGPAIAVHTTPLLMVLVAGTTFGIFAQQNSTAILYGIAAHKAFAWGLLVEAILLAAGIVLVLPRGGLLGVAILSTALLILDRGLRTAWLLCRSLHLPLLPFLERVYAMPMLLAIPTAVFGYLLHRLVPGRNWTELLSCFAAIGVVYYSMGLVWVVSPVHRALLFESVRRWFPRTVAVE